MWRHTRSCIALVLAALALLASASQSQAHGYTTLAYADITSPTPHTMRAKLSLEYDLLVVSAATAHDDDALFDDGIAAWEEGDLTGQATALDGHAEAVAGYIAERFAVTAGEAACVPAQEGGASTAMREGVPYAVIVLDYACPPAERHTFSSRLFPDEEGYTTAAKTLLTYSLDEGSGSAMLDAETPSLSTGQSTAQRLVEFFLLGAEHLLGGLDHILFLLAIIVGSRRLREIVLAATAFTAAHSVTFILAATGMVHLSGRLVEPVIALSIAAVAAWHLAQIRIHGLGAADMHGSWALTLDRAGWMRLGVVFCFGLAHGLGFAGALGIDEPWSWSLLWSLLVFNLGLEAVQLCIIAAVFPLLAWMRRRSVRMELWVTGVIAGGVGATGLVWFVQRLVL